MYVAAVIDSTAVIRTREASGVVYPHVQINGGNTALLRFLAEATGMRMVVTRRDYTRAGCSEHCAEKHQHIVSVSGRWMVSGAKATVVLAASLPYLRLQRDTALEALSVGLAAPYKPASLRKMRELGWPIPEFNQRGLST